MNPQEHLEARFVGHVLAKAGMTPAGVPAAVPQAMITAREAVARGLLAALAPLDVRRRTLTADEAEDFARSYLEDGDRGRSMADTAIRSARRALGEVRWNAALEEILGDVAEGLGRAYADRARRKKLPLPEPGAAEPSAGFRVTPATVGLWWCARHPEALPAEEPATILGGPADPEVLSRLAKDLDDVDVPPLERRAPRPRAAVLWDSAGKAMAVPGDRRARALDLPGIRAATVLVGTSGAAAPATANVGIVGVVDGGVHLGTYEHGWMVFVRADAPEGTNWVQAIEDFVVAGRVRDGVLEESIAFQLLDRGPLRADEPPRLRLLDRRARDALAELEESMADALEGAPGPGSRGAAVVTGWARVPVDTPVCRAYRLHGTAVVVFDQTPVARFEADHPGVGVRAVAVTNAAPRDAVLWTEDGASWPGDLGLDAPEGFQVDIAIAIPA